MRLQQVTPDFVKIVYVLTFFNQCRTPLSLSLPLSFSFKMIELMLGRDIFTSVTRLSIILFTPFVLCYFFMDFIF